MNLPPQVGPYTVLRELGRGGMGTVFLAEDPRLGRLVALKLLLPTGQGDSEGMARLLKEARAAAKLEHPNVCPIFEVGESAVGPFIAMQYVEGDTVDVRLAQARPALQEVVSWGVQIAEALAEAHQIGILHRDVKPQNLMITPKGQVKVLDFGLAKIMTHQGRAISQFTLLTQDGPVIGTLPYMSPEQVRGDGLDGRSDVFSLGSVLFESATGRRPFPATDSADLAGEILMKDPFSENGADHLPPEFRAILTKALQKRKVDRYPSAEALAADLRVMQSTLQASAALASGPLPIWSPDSGGAHSVFSSSGDALKPSTSSSRGFPRALVARTWWLLGGLGLAVAAPAMYFSAPSIRSQPQALESIAVLPFTCAQGNAETEALCDDLTEQLINQLASLPNLKVIARGSVQRGQGPAPDLKSLAGELGVKAVLTGQLEQKGEDVTLTIQMVEAASLRSLLGKQYTCNSQDSPSLQDHLMRDLGRKGLVALPPAGSTPRVSGQAHALVLRAKRALSRFTLEGVQKAFAFLDEALRLSPGFAQAEATRAYGYLLASSQFMPSAEALPLMQAAAERALKLDRRNAEAHTLLALALAHNQFDFQGAEQQFRRGLELAPGSARAHEMYGYFLTARGRKEDAAKALDKALELDPLSANLHLTKSLSCIFSRDWHQAIRHAERAHQLDPQSQRYKTFLAMALLGRNEVAEALKKISEVAGPPGLSTLGCQGVALARLGRRSEALTLARGLTDPSLGISALPSHLAAAQVFAALGDQEAALAHLEISRKTKEEAFIFAEFNPFFDDLRSTQKFRALFK